MTLNRAVGRITLERNIAAGALDDAKAEALLSCNDEILRKKGHAKTSADLREAVATLDPTVKAARARLNEIKAVLAYLEGKATAFLNAYNSVKKLVDNRGLPPADLHAPAHSDRIGNIILRSQKQGNAATPDKPMTLEEEPLADFEEPLYARRY